MTPDNAEPPAGADRIVVIGTGNPCRGDDAVGVEFSRRLRALVPDDVEVVALAGEPATLMEAWGGAATVFVVDAVGGGPSGAGGPDRPAPGQILRFDAHSGALPVRLFGGSSHDLGVAEAIELARALGRLPRRLIVYGIAGASFGHGEPLTPAVDTACRTLVSIVLEHIRRIKNAGESDR